MQIMRVLVVEDHERLARAVAEGLRREGMAVDLSLDGADALAHVAVNRYDVVVLDRDLPAVHGDQVCRRLVEQQSETRVLMLTAASTISDRVEGLELGADDYLPKPFEFAELVARVRALGRRAARALPPKLVRGDLTLDSARHVAFRGDRRLALEPEGVRAARVPARRRWPGRFGGGAPRQGVGRGGRPVHQHGEDDDRAAALKARRSAGDRDDPRGGYCI